MKKSVFCFICLIPILAYNQIISIPSDYPTIQQGINAAYNGDTILVEQGTYIENINFNGKSITVASHFLLTLDPSYIDQTIIDGSQNGSVVVFSNDEDSTTSLIGFTITNGQSGAGGGIQCWWATPSIENCIITSNVATGNPQGMGGGIFCYSIPDSLCKLTLKDVIISNNESGGTFGGLGGGIFCQKTNMLLENVKINNNSTSNLYGNWEAGGGICAYGPPNTFHLKGVTISNNLTKGKGGGIYAEIESAVLNFDDINRCNIYSNTGGIGADIYSGDNIDVVLDTFSVIYPTEYYAEPLLNFIFSINYGVIQQIDSDLFVSPNGSNLNSGLTHQDPLQTIDYALSIILVDRHHPNTINLLEGIYSHSNNHEFYPINMPDYVNIEGITDSLVFLDAEGAERVIIINDNESNHISGICLQNGYGNPEGGGIYCIHSNPIFQNVTITNCYANGPATGGRGGGAYFEGSNPSLQNATIEWNVATRGAGIYSHSDLTITNSVIKNNSALEGGGIYGGIYHIENVVISNNLGSGIFGGGDGKNVFQNVTLAHNQSALDTIGGGIFFSGNCSLLNSIVYGNLPYDIGFQPDFHPLHEDTLRISYSNIQGGLEGISLFDDDVVLWQEGNIDIFPSFVSSGNHPLALMDGSPCIDAGTSDTSGLNLIAWDLLGNFRIWDGNYDGDTIIDMGAYEFGAPLWVRIDDDNLPPFNQNTEIHIYPNPARYIFHITANEGKELSELIIYTLTGQQVLQSRPVDGTIDISHLQPGTYIVEVVVDGKKARRKLVVE